jgi:hypothetical protein
MTDVLAMRSQEMRGNPHGALSRHDPVQTRATLWTLLTRTLALKTALGSDQSVGVPLATARDRFTPYPELYLDASASVAWDAMGSLVAAFLGVEVRLAGLEGRVVDPLAEEGLLSRMMGQLACDGCVHRHPANFWEAMTILVHRVQAAEARLRSSIVQAALVKANQAPTAIPSPTLPEATAKP